MTIIETYAPGQFCWVDLMAKDMEDAASFYGELFGWDFRLMPSHGDGAPGYGQLTQDGHPVAGVGQMSPEMIAGGMPSVWSSYVAVGSCAETEAKAKALGAEVVFSTLEAPAGAGWLCYLKDPTGAVFATWQAGSHGGAALVNAPCSFAWNELATPDLEASKAFYRALFGWTFEAIESPAKVPSALVKNQGRMNGHMLQMNEQWAGIPPHWGVYFAVADTDATIAEVERLGGKVCVAPMDIPPGRFSVVQDRADATFTVIALADPDWRAPHGVDTAPGLRRP